MGGWGSGRSGGRPTADVSHRIDIAWMMRTRRAIPGRLVSGTLHWTCGGEPSGSIGYAADMRNLDAAELLLFYWRSSSDDREDVKQTVRLTYTLPHYGGRRWWMICPYRHTRCGKLYLPAGGDRFAGRTAWRLGYRSQRLAHRDRPFEKLSRLQRKLDSYEGYEAGLRRPKGMWRRTYERHLDRYCALEEECDYEFALMAAKLLGRR